MTPDPIVSIKDLVVSFKAESGKSFMAIRNVSLDIIAGEVISLVGESGSGKTTLCRATIGLTKRSSGSIDVSGRPLQYDSRHLRELWREVQMVFQDPYSTFNPLVPILEAIATPLHKFGHGDDTIAARVESIVSRVGLKYHELKGKYPSQLSGGERQRASIARALVTNPKVLIADEPISMLDVSLKAGILNLLKDLNAEQNLTVLFVTHDLNVAGYLSDRIAVMHKGEVVEVGATRDIIYSPKMPYTRLLLDSVPTLGSSEWLTSRIPG